MPSLSRTAKCFPGDLDESLPVVQETWVQFLGQEDPLEKEMATHSSILAWKIPWTVAHQAPLSVEFSRQERWSGLPFPSPEDLLDSGIETRSPALQADSLLSELPGKPHFIYMMSISS